MSSEAVLANGILDETSVVFPPHVPVMLHIGGYRDHVHARMLEHDVGSHQDVVLHDGLKERDPTQGPGHVDLLARDHTVLALDPIGMNPGVHELNKLVLVDQNLHAFT